LVEKSALLDDLMQLTHKKVNPDEVAKESAAIDAKLKIIENELEKLPPKVSANEIASIRDIRQKLIKVNYAALNPQEVHSFAQDVKRVSDAVQKITQPEQPSVESIVRKALGHGDKTFQQLRDLTKADDKIIRGAIDRLIQKGDIGWYGKRTAKDIRFTTNFSSPLVKRVIPRVFNVSEIKQRPKYPPIGKYPGKKKKRLRGH